MIWAALLASRFVWGAAAAALIGWPAVGWVSYRVGHASGWSGGVAAERARWQAERARVLEQAQAQAKVARAQGRAIAAELERTRAALRADQLARSRAIDERASSTATCLSPAVAAALNAAPASETAEPQAAASSAGGTSERAAAGWIADAQQAHEACRAQVGALAEWIRAAGSQP
jgi:hypothetical protein